MEKILTTIIFTLILSSCGSNGKLQSKIELDPDPLCKFKIGRTLSKTVEDILDGDLFNFANKIDIEVPYRLPKPKDLPKGSVAIICSNL
jgi:hypothetical protein